MEHGYTATPRNYYLIINQAKAKSDQKAVVEVCRTLIKHTTQMEGKHLTTAIGMLLSTKHNAQQNLDLALQLVECMKGEHYVLDHIVYTVLISGCTKASRFDIADNLVLEIRGVKSTVQLATAVLKMYCESNRIEKAIEMLHSAQKRDPSMYATIIWAGVEAKQYDIVNVLVHEIERENVQFTTQLAHAIIKLYCSTDNIEKAMDVLDRVAEPHASLYTTILAACKRENSYELGDTIIKRLKTCKVVPTTELQTSLMMFYYRRGMFDQVMKEFNIPVLKDARMYATMLKACTEKGRVDVVENIMSEIKTNGIHRTLELQIAIIKSNTDSATDVFQANTSNEYLALLTTCMDVNNIVLAEQLYESLKNQSFECDKLQTAVIKYLLKTHRVDEAVAAFDTMKHRDVHSYSVIIQGCCDAGELDIADRIYSEMNHVTADTFLLNSIIQLHCKQNRFDSAWDVFNGIQSPNAISYIVILSGALDAKRFDVVQKVHNTILGTSDTKLANHSMKLYFKHNQVDYAVQVFDKMQKKDSVSYIVMISGLTAVKRLDIAEQYDQEIMDSMVLFKSMPLYNSVIKYIVQNRGVDSALDIAQRNGLYDDVTLVILLTACTDAHQYTKADILAEKVKDTKVTTELLNTLVKFYNNSDQLSSSLTLYHQYQQIANDVTLMLLVSGCAAQKRYDQLDRILEQNTTMTQELLSTLLSMYFDRFMVTTAHELFWQHIHCITDVSIFILVLMDSSSIALRYDLESKITSGQFEHPLNTCALILFHTCRAEYTMARQVFNNTKCKDRNLYNVMLYSYKYGARFAEAIALLQEMKRSNIKPDAKSYNQVLSACSHSGNVKEAELIIQELREERMLTDIHVSCMVDAYSRSGDLNRAEELALSIKDSKTVWMSVLGGCKKFGDTERALRVLPFVKHKSNRATALVLLANTYASAGMLDQRDQVRGWLEDDEKKIPGVSYIKIGNTVHRFYVEDKDAPQEVIEYLDSLRVQIENEFQYTPDLKCVLKRLPTREEKVKHLWRHSEKIALGVGLLNTSGTVEITKNLRMCLDCHTAAKLISRITQRTLIINDTFRGHRFENGVCDCNDFY
jgi:pentatricopeptide repeat protein